MELSQIKVFRRLLSERTLMRKNGWKAFCENFLSGKLVPLWEKAESELGLNFITSRSGDGHSFLDRKPEWDRVVSLMGRHGIGSSDAMILNMFFCSKVPAFLTADLELAEVAVEEAQEDRQIFIPDSLIT